MGDWGSILPGCGGFFKIDISRINIIKEPIFRIINEPQQIKGERGERHIHQSKFKDAWAEIGRNRETASLQ
jgi:hypothetical protein